MKKILFGLILIVAADTAKAQTGVMQVPRTHIQSPPNATYQNHAQFYNKDNHSIAVRPNVVTTSNGTYWAPGNSNESNRMPYTNGLAPNGSINGSMNTSANSFYNSTINYSSPNAGSTNTNRATPSNINSNVTNSSSYRP
jgi:hypothetical protein